MNKDMLRGATTVALITNASLVDGAARDVIERLEAEGITVRLVVFWYGQAHATFHTITRRYSEALDLLELEAVVIVRAQGDVRRLGMVREASELLGHNPVIRPPIILHEVDTPVNDDQGVKPELLTIRRQSADASEGG